jgi:C-terminal processing protease CtpA/Prc
MYCAMRTCWHDNEWIKLFLLSFSLVESSHLVNTRESSWESDHLFAQVGIMFNGAGFVESLLPGGPAHSSQKIEKGDQIVKVDGNKVVGTTNLSNAITGNDIPGSKVTFTIQHNSV